MIKLIVADMDGTLLNEAKVLPSGMFELIQALHKKGVKFAIASGRQYFNLVKNFEAIQEDLIFIAENGMFMAEGKKELRAYSLEKEAVQIFVERCRNVPNAYPVVCGKNSAYIEHDIPEFIEHVEQYYAKYELVKSLDEINDDVLKIAILDLEGTQEHVYPYFKEFAQDYMVSVSAFEWMDIMTKGIHKGKAVEALQEMYDITYDETLLFGDFMNDYEMMQTGYHSYAMKNAHPELKKVCNFETEFTNEDEGVKRELERMFELK